MVKFILKEIILTFLFVLITSSIFCQQEMKSQNILGGGGGLNLNFALGNAPILKDNINGFIPTFMFAGYYEHMFASRDILNFGLAYDKRSYQSGKDFFGDIDQVKEQWISVPIMFGHSSRPNHYKVTYQGYVGYIAGVLIKSEDIDLEPYSVVKSSGVIQISARSEMGNAFAEAGLKGGMDFKEYSKHKEFIQYYTFVTIFFGVGIRL